ncbi:hypothetical protein HMI51_37580 [Corallococcus coralloides]|nr:hypothetical protein [Corallococcus coralloides]
MVKDDMLEFASSQVRLRIGERGRYVVTVLAPQQQIRARLILSLVRQELVTVRCSQWSQVEVETISGFCARRARRVTETAPEGRDAIMIMQSVFDGGQERRRTITRIGLRGEIEWLSRDGRSHQLIGEGRGIDGAGSGMAEPGFAFSFRRDDPWTTTTHSVEGGATRQVKETETRAYDLVKWETKDSTGRVTNSGGMTTDKATGEWRFDDETRDDTGGKLVIEASGDEMGAGRREATRFDADGNEVGRQVEIHDGQGNSTRSTLTKDLNTGEETLETVSTGSDGVVSTHKQVWDSSGNIIVDETTINPPPSGGTGSGGSGDGGDGDSDDDGRTNDDSGDNGDDDAGGSDDGDDDADGSDDDGGDDADGGDGEEASSDGLEGDGDGAGRPPLIDGPGGPRFPGGTLAKILHEFGVSGGGGGGEEWNEGNGPVLTAERMQRIIDAAHHGGPAPEDDTSDGIGNGRQVITLAVPSSVIEDWNDHPRPETIEALARWMLSQDAALSPVGASLQRLADGLRRQRQTG